MATEQQTIYSITGTTLSGRNFSFDQYKGKVLLVVNTASKCGHDYQLGLLEDLYKEFKDQGFEIIGFPSDQFAQEPLEGEAIAEHCSINYGVTFPMMAKTKVRGADAHPLYKFFADKKANGKFSNRPKWNFYKYLIGRDGKVIDYFWTYRKPNNPVLRKAVQNALAFPLEVSPVV